MTEPDDLDLLRRAVAPHVRGDSPSTPDCPDEETTAAVAEGSLDEESRVAALGHLAVCARCRSQVASAARALADPEIDREVRTLERGRRRRPGWNVWATVAAAAMLLLLARPEQFVEIQHRSPPTGTTAVPSAVSPVGTVAEVPSLRWTSVAGADAYRITLFDAEAGLLYETVLADTVAVLPASVPLTPGESYRWGVEARIGFDRWTDAVTTSFSISRVPGR